MASRVQEQTNRILIIIIIIIFDKLLDFNIMLEYPT